MASANGSNKKRHVFLDREDTNTGCKRICVEPPRSPMGLDSPSDFNNIYEVEPSTIFPNVQFIETASEPLNSLTAHPPTRFTAEQHTHGLAYPLSNYGQVFGASHSAAGCALPSHSSLFMFPRSRGTLLYIANMSFRFFDTELRAQTAGPSSSTLALLNTSQDNDENLSFDFNTQTHQIQEVKDLGFIWGIDRFDPIINPWASAAASLSHHPESGPQEWLQHSAFAQTQSPETTFFPANIDNSVVETGIKTGIPTEWTCMENQVPLVDPGTFTNTEIESRHHGPTTSEFSTAALDSSNLGQSSRLRGVSTPSSIHLTELSACDEMHHLEPIIDLPEIPQYDACFGVVSHRQPTGGLKEC